MVELLSNLPRRGMLPLGQRPSVATALLGRTRFLLLLLSPRSYLMIYTVKGNFPLRNDTQRTTLKGDDAETR